METIKELAIPAATFYLLCCTYIGYKDKDWVEVGISSALIVLAVGSLLWYYS